MVFTRWLLCMVVQFTIYQVEAAYIGNSQCRERFGGVCRTSCWSGERPIIVPKGVSYCRRGRCCGSKTAHGVWSGWRWTPCSTSCGPGRQIRTRTCLSGLCLGTPDPYGPTTRKCNKGQCPSKWTPWSQWGKCFCSLGIQKRNRTRTCSSTCNASRIEIGQRKCSCYTPWGRWSDCTTTCGTGIRTRERRCTGVCSKTEQAEICSEQPCPTPSPTTDKPGNNVTTTKPATTLPPPVTRQYCSQRDVKPRALGSVETQCDSTPWAVSFELRGTISEDGDLRVHICNGALITPSKVITTNVCGETVQGQAFSNHSWIAVMRTADGTTNLREIKSVEILGNSTAVVTLSSEFTMDTCISPVCLPSENQDPTTYHSCRIAGYVAELSSELVYDVPSLFKTANVTLMSAADCEEMFPTQSGNIVCTDSKTDYVAICPEDEGWMLMCEDRYNQSTLVGLAIAQDGPHECTTDQPSRFQDVQSALAWISDLLQPTSWNPPTNHKAIK